MFAPVVLGEGGLVLSDEPRVDDWAWLFDPLGDAWWDPADTGAEPGIEVDAEVEALLAGLVDPRAGSRAAPMSGRSVDPRTGRLPSGAPGVGVQPRTGAGVGVTSGVDVEAHSGAPAGVAPVEVGSDVADEVPWLSAACLAGITPGAGLAGVLERVDLPSADDELLVEAVAAGERLAAWAHLLAALAAGELSHRASMNPLWSAPAPSRTCVAGDELAMRLGWSRPAATRLVRDGRALEGVLLPVADAVREGLIDTPKLRVLTDRLHDRAYQLSWPVLEQVLPQAATRTPTQLAADVDRALLAVDPVDAAIRLPRAVASRHVCHPRRLPDGMAGLWAVLPATDAARIDATLEATARAARAAGDPRTLDQLRADTLTDLATGTALLAGAHVAGNTGPVADAGLSAAAGDGARAAATGRDAPRQDRAMRRAGNIDPAARFSTAGRPVGAGQANDESVGAGQANDESVGAGQANDESVGAGITCQGGRYLQAATGVPVADGDVIEAALSLPASGSAPAVRPEDTQEASDNMRVAQADRPPGRAAPGIRIPKVRIDVTVALSTLMGLDDKPGELAGLGPIPAEQARALARGGTWRRIVTDPLTGAVLDVGRTRYRPPAGLAEHVLARDGVCAAPGCSVPGHRCDIDHTTEYYGLPANGSPLRGSTSADNLGPLSNRCHRLKTDGGFTLRQVHSGVFEWRTPAGLTYRVTPGNHGRTEKLDQHPRADHPDTPPF